MAIKAICVVCGKPKRDPFKICKACNFKPETEYQMARAMVFSLPSSADNSKVGRNSDNLKLLSKQIIGGRPYEFDPAEVEAAVLAYRQLIQANLEKKKTTKKIAVITFILAILITGITTLYILR